MGLDPEFVEAVRLIYSSIVFGHHILYELLDVGRIWHGTYIREVSDPAAIACDQFKTYEQSFDCMMFKRIIKGE